MTTHEIDIERAEDGHQSLFAQIRHESDDGYEYWSARELARALGYGDYRNFLKVVEKARVACENSGYSVEDHFVDTTDMIAIGKGGKRKVADIHLSRYGCYLIVQNADPSKEVVALGQTYFAVQTQRQEEADEMAGLTEAQKRLYLREQLSTHNKQLADAANRAGVIMPMDFAIFQDHGYMGLYGDLKSSEIHTRKGLKPSQRILDHMGSTELAANLFRATQTEDKLRRERIQGKESANRTHYEVGRKVRQTIEELGGTLPEDLPSPDRSIQQLQREEKKRLEKGEQMTLLPDASSND